MYVAMTFKSGILGEQKFWVKKLPMIKEENISKKMSIENLVTVYWEHDSK